MSWVAAGLLAAGTAAKVGGGIISQNEALANAKAQAAARNASVAGNLQKLSGLEDQNQGTFGLNTARYDPTAQAAQLAGAQQTRGDANVANISTDNPAATPIQSDASPATRSDLAKRMGAVHDMATERARAMGTLGGYGDAWLGNQLGNAQASRDIGVTNNYAEGRKALIEPEAELASQSAYKPPSIWGQLLGGAGSVALAAGGAKFGGGGGSTAAAGMKGIG